MTVNQIKSFFTNPVNLIGLVFALLGSWMLFPDYFVAQILPVPAGTESWRTLDASWMLALNYAHIDQLEWGNDFAFTYGPLGYFCTRIGWGQSRWPLFLYDIFVALNYAAIFFLSFKQSKNKIFSALAIVSVILFFPAIVVSAKSLALMAFLIFWIRMSLDNPRPVYYAFQVGLVTSLFFIKFNTGLIVFVFYAFGLAYSAIKGKIKPLHLAIYLAIPLFLILFLAALLNVALVPYVKSGLEMVKGYNDLMYLENQIDGSVSYMWYTYLLIGVLLFFNIRKEAKKDYLKGLLVVFIMAVSLYVIYKQATVRADVNHLYEFFLVMPLMILCSVDLHRHLQNMLAKVIFVTALALPIFFLFIKQDNPVNIAQKFKKDNYFTIFSLFNPTTGMDFFGAGIQLPASVKAKIGNATVDSYPWNIQMLFENKLNYAPRPVCQSYTAYTPYLENLNFEHYNDVKTAPDFMIYQFEAIDNRYAIFDEAKLNLALSKNYEIAEIFDLDGRPTALFQKKKNFVPITLKKTNEYAMAFGSPIVPKKGAYYEIGVYHTLTGKFDSAINHAPELNLIIQPKVGDRRNYKIGAMLLQSGIFSNVFIQNANDLKYLCGADGGNEIKFLKIEAKHPHAFKDKIRITEYTTE